VALRSRRIEARGGIDATHGASWPSGKEGLSVQTFALSRIALIFLFLALSTLASEAGNMVIFKQFVTEPPTLISLGFEWEIDGDANPPLWTEAVSRTLKRRTNRDGVKKEDQLHFESTRN
jgi:hypothetical protein